MNRSIELNRKHISEAFVDYCKRRSGGHPVCTVIVNRQQVIIGELRVEAVLRCLTDCFEAACFEKYGQANSIKLLASTYAGMLNKDNSKLSPEGIEFMALLMSNAVEVALKNPQNNTLGLELY
ncbi:hypothetical protein [Serratia rubidaea]|uniref:Uncharacterized protein n=1 Tax=Serratia rubidaea TaxID=61652 RepID=A0ABS0MF25_SERRU|nr:hypothetical protein [Serratia rubidaea]MBH1930896.1 hypothetical protein [Serratia rubidaea]